MSPWLQTVIVNAIGTLLIVVCPGHVAFVGPLVDDEDNLGSNLRAEKGGVVIAHFFPLWKVIWNLRCLDTRRRLAM